MPEIKVKTYVLPPRYSETVLHELDPRYSNKIASLAASEKDLPFGLVLMRDEAGVYSPLTEESGTLQGTPSAVLLTEVEASAEPASVLVLTGYCVVNANGLVFDPSVTLKTKALAALEDRGFVIEEVANAPA